MADMITRCPQCATAFRITTTQLSSAKGSVRCGSCFTIFNALENLTERHPAPAAAFNFTADDMLISDNMGIDGEEPEHNVSSHSSYKTPKQKLFAKTAAQAKRKAQEVEPDESWALELLDEEDLREIPHSEDEDFIEEEPSFRAFAAPQPSPPLDLSDDFLRATGTVPSPTPPTSSPAAEELPVVEPSPTPQATTAVQPAMELALTPAVESPAAESPATPDAKPQSLTQNARLIDNIQPEPLELAWRAKRNGTTRLWVAGSLVGIIALGLQIGAMQIKQWRHKEPFAPLYSAACQWLSCPADERVDLDKIVTTKLLVRSHPTSPNALQVDAIILNKAPFPQRFPPLILSFRNLQNQLLAERVFQPAEYLAGELSGQTQFPSRQAVHIALEVIDPGKEAVGYSLVVLQ